jgi:large subunit ribosomal protein L18
MKSVKLKAKRYLSRKSRVRAKLSGTAARPRLSVFRSNNHIYGQLIDDEGGTTLVSASDLVLGKKLKTAGKKKTEISQEAGEELAKKARVKKIKEVVFDRNGFKFHGRIKAFAQGAREGGLKF